MATACTCCEILADVWLELVKVFCQHRQCHSTNLSDCGLRRLIVGAQSLDTPCTSATRCSFTFHPRIWSYSAWAQGCGLWRHLDPKSSRRLRSEHGHHSVCSCGLRYKRRQTENGNIGGGSVKKSMQSSTTTTTTITTAILKDFL